MTRVMAIVVCAGVVDFTVSNAPGTGTAQSLAQEQTDAQTLDRVATLARERNARDYAIDTARGIDEGRYVRIGGIEQWITIRGQDRRNPVLLFLHGGPGDATNPWAYAVFRPWLRAFTVVQWDQRGTGRTLHKTGRGVADTITVERMAQDGIELAELLRRSQQKDKILLVGHSWGSVLGMAMVKARPELFLAYVGTGQVGAVPSRAYAAAYDALVQKAMSLGEAGAIRELKEVGPPPYADGRGYAVQRKWANQFEGAHVFLAATLTLARAAPGYMPGDIADWLAGQQVTADRLVPELFGPNAKPLANDFALPVFVIQGAEDFTTPTSLARAFAESLHAPRKAYIEIPEAGHFAVFMKPEAFLHVLESRVLRAIASSNASKVSHP